MKESGSIVSEGLIVRTPTGDCTLGCLSERGFGRVPAISVGASIKNRWLRQRFGHGWREHRTAGQQLLKVLPRRFVCEENSSF